MTTDLKAVHHMLFNSYDYPKTKLLRHVSRELFGNGALCSISLGIHLLPFYIGLLIVEGDEHKDQVRFCFKDLFTNCCLILLVAQDFGRLCWAIGVPVLNV